MQDQDQIHKSRFLGQRALRMREGKVASCECECVSVWCTYFFEVCVLHHPGLVLESKPEASHGPGDITQLRPSRSLWGLPAVAIHLQQDPRPQVGPVKQVVACRPPSTPRPGLSEDNSGSRRQKNSMVLRMHGQLPLAGLSSDFSSAPLWPCFGSSLLLSPAPVEWSRHRAGLSRWPAGHVL